MCCQDVEKGKNKMIEIIKWMISIYEIQKEIENKNK